MKPIHSVSFPRSGHKLVTDLLRAYFGPDFIYSDGDLVVTPGAHWLKHHDEDLTLPVESTQRYIVQVRDPFDSMHSWYDMTRKLVGLRESRATFTGIFSEKLDYWSGFVRKWVLTEHPNVWVFHYRDVVTQPVEALARMLQVFGESPSGWGRIVEAVKRVNIEEHRMPEFYL